MTRTGVTRPLWPRGLRRGGSPAPAKFEASGAALRGAQGPSPRSSLGGVCAAAAARAGQRLINT